MNPPHCCVCLNLDNSVLVPMVTVIQGYSVCQEHAEFMAAPFSDFAQLIARLKAANPTETAL